MVDTFNPAIPPQEEPQGEVMLRVRKTQFGDGYSQVGGDGLNPKVQNWPLVFRGTTAEITPIRDFMDAHIGISFYWTPPLGVQGRYACFGYQLIPAVNNNYQLNVKLEQVFFP